MRTQYHIPCRVPYHLAVRRAQPAVNRTTTYPSKQPKVGEVWAVNGVPTEPLLYITRVSFDHVYFTYGRDGSPAMLPVATFLKEFHFYF